MSISLHESSLPELISTDMSCRTNAYVADLHFINRTAQEDGAAAQSVHINRFPSRNLSVPNTSVFIRVVREWIMIGGMILTLEDIVQFLQWEKQYFE